MGATGTGSKAPGAELVGGGAVGTTPPWNNQAQEAKVPGQALTTASSFCPRAFALADPPREGVAPLPSWLWSLQEAQGLLNSQLFLKKAWLGPPTTHALFSPTP